MNTVGLTSLAPEREGQSWLCRLMDKDRTNVSGDLSATWAGGSLEVTVPPTLPAGPYAVRWVDHNGDAEIFYGIQWTGSEVGQQLTLEELRDIEVAAIQNEAIASSVSPFRLR